MSLVPQGHKIPFKDGIEAFMKFRKEIGHTPSIRELELRSRLKGDVPTPSWFRKKFGDYRKALRAMRVPPPPTSLPPIFKNYLESKK